MGSGLLDEEPMGETGEERERNCCATHEMGLEESEPSWREERGGDEEMTVATTMRRFSWRRVLNDNQLYVDEVG